MYKLTLETSIEQKPLSSYTDEMIANMKLLSFNQKKIADPFGSGVFRVQKYPSDVDLIEIVQDCCTIDDVINKFARRIQEIVRKMSMNKVHYFSEFKSGKDIRYDIDLGNIQNGVWQPNAEMIYKKSVSLYNKGLFNDKEFNVIKQIMFDNNKRSGDDYDVVKYIFRERMILRWTKNEILNGYKELPGNIFMPLKKAISMKSHVKIDMITIINNMFVEVTNFFILANVENDKVTFINTDVDYFNKNVVIESFKSSIRDEIEKLYYSNQFYSPFKVVKRMFSFARIIQDNNLLPRIVELYSSDLSLAYKLSSDIETIIRVINIVKNPPYKAIYKQLQILKSQLVYVLVIPKKTLIMLNNHIDDFNKINNKEDKIILLKNVKKIIKSFVNAYTIEELTKLGLNPPPRNYLPAIVKYKNITRKPSDDPINPLSLYGISGGENIIMKNKYKCRK